MSVDTTNSNAQLPAATTNAVLSYVDAAGGHVSIVRHWRGPGTGQDTQVVPFTGYMWDGCLPFQDGALMVLVTTPVGYPPPGLTSAEAYTTQYLTRLGHALRSSVATSAAQLAQGQPTARQNLQQIGSSLETPGDPAYELIKAVLGQINSLSAYEDYGYAVFMFIRWKWVYTPFPVPAPCSQVDFRAVPEGYGVPFVAGNISLSSQQPLRLMAEEHCYRGLQWRLVRRGLASDRATCVNRAAGGCFGNLDNVHRDAKGPTGYLIR